jgi:signal transduction histidine kinase
MSLDALYRIADLVAHVREPEDIYDAAVDAMVAATGADRASLLLFDADGVMRFKAWRGLSDGYRDAVEGHSPWVPDTKDPVPILVSDVATDTSLGPLRDVVLNEGIQALGFIPLGRSERLLGKFMVYYNAPHDFAELEMKVAAMVCHYVAFGLERARADAAIAELLDRERSARREAEALNRAKDDFLAMLSHELRNPLNAIVNAVSVLDLIVRPEPGTVKPHEVIRRQTKHLTRLLDDLLDAAKVGRGHLEVRPEVTDLRSAAAAAVEKLSHLCVQKRQTLHVTLPDEPVVVKGDPNRLQQIAANLLDNASKYTPEAGSIWLTVASDEGEATLRVRDDGIGIPADRLSSLFDPFSQINSTLARTTGGLGIGLTIVKRLVELHSGTIEVATTGRGATFTVRLPLTADLVPPRQPEPSPGPVHRWRVVVIEDNDDGREALVLALRTLGHEVHAANTGRAGIELVQRTQPDWVLVDIGLPDIDGYDVARMLRTVSGGGSKLIALTGYGQNADRKRSAEAGFAIHLVKPVAPVDLMKILESASGAR